MEQRWEDLLFMHWPVEAGALRAHLPTGLQLDLYEGTAWLSVTPFHLSNLRPRRLPAAGPLSSFHELNVRTYVTVGARPGVYFFSLDASKWHAVIGARLFFHLPYEYADIKMSGTAGGGFIYRSHRKTRSRPADLDISYMPTGPVSSSEPGSLDWWLTERYCLYSVAGAGRVYRVEIHHPRWPLQPATVEVRRNTMAAAAGIALPAIEPRVSFSRRLDVLVWNKERMA